MKLETTITAVSALIAVILSYFKVLVMSNSEQFLAVVLVMFLDGIFGIIAGTKKEGFKTSKALNILRNTFVWIIILTTTLIVENAFKIAFISESFILPFVVFQLISAIKNAHRCGYVKAELLQTILSKIDNHKV
jgi:phage-related holin